MNTKTEICQQIILSTDDKSHVVKNKIYNHLFYGGKATLAEHRNGFCENQHLYITSDETVKVGDWYLVKLYDITNKSVGYNLEQCKIIKEDIWINSEKSSLIDTRHINNCKKVIASTDLSLNVLNIPIEHLKTYCEQNGCNNFIKINFVETEEKTWIPLRNPGNLVSINIE